MSVIEPAKPPLPMKSSLPFQAVGSPRLKLTVLPGVETNPSTSQKAGTVAVAAFADTATTVVSGGAMPFTLDRVQVAARALPLRASDAKMLSAQRNERNLRRFIV